MIGSAPRLWVGDTFTSLIHTAELHGKNPFDYLTAPLRHARSTYEATLAGLPPQA